MQTVQLVKAQKLEHERKIVNGLPEPTALIAFAVQEEPKPIYLCASDYGEVINILRQKGFTWAEITLWLGEKGANFSQQAITSGWRTWERNQTPPEQLHISARLMKDIQDA